MIRLIAILLLLGGPAAAHASNQADPRLRTITYEADQVVRLQVPANFHVAIIFGAEQVQNVALGDSEAWEATLNANESALFVKPLRPGGPTNMTVITDARVYSFELSSAYGPMPDAPFTVRFRHSLPSSDGGLPDLKPRLGLYRVSGSRALRPVAVIDDGLRTSIEWRPDQPIPAVFALDEGGAETLVEGHMRDGLYVIDAVYRGLVFRLDRQNARAARVQSRSGG